MYSFQFVHSFILLLCLLVCIQNGASYYIEVFAKHYEKELEQKARKPTPLDPQEPATFSGKKIPVVTSANMSVSPENGGRRSRTQLTDNGSERNKAQYATKSSAPHGVAGRAGRPNISVPDNLRKRAQYDRVHG